METGSVSSIPSSSISNSSARSTPTPNQYKPLTQSASLLALTKLPDDELRRHSTEELLQIVRRLEAENRTLVAEHSNMVKDVNKKVQILFLEVRGLKDVNQNLQDDNQELRDLCCFLDDDRQRGRKLAREWQRFGRYTASVMRSEVSAYQEKLKELEAKQQELISDNFDLKELCLYLDQERLRASQPRDDGDGSSSSTIAGNEDTQRLNDIELVPVNQLDNSTGHTENDAVTNEYIRQLEEKIRHLEKEKKKMSKLGRNTSDTPIKETPYVQVTGTQRVGPDGNQTQDNSSAGNKATSPNKPEAVVHAMKVLEVHENLERPQTAVGEDNILDDKEKAIVREMCNVVWRKLGSVKAEQQEAHQALQPPVYENLQPQPVRSKSTPPEATGARLDSAGPALGDPRDRYYTEQHYRTDPEPQGGYRPYPESAMSYQGQPTAYIQRTGNSKGHTVFQVAPTYPSQDVRRYDDYQGQSQRPPPGPETQTYGPSVSSQYSGTKQSKSGYVQTSRSTPVTPVPQQQSQPPMSSQKPRSHSPGPVRRAVTPRSSDMPRSHSPGPNTRIQYPRSDSQTNAPVYQNQQVHGNMGDNSYENVPSSSSYYPQTPQNFNHNRSVDSNSSAYDYPAPHPHALSSNPYPFNSASASKTSRSQPTYHQTPTQYHPPPNSQSPPYYQNMPARSSEPARNNRDSSTASSNLSYQGAPPTPIPHRHTPSSQMYPQGHQSYPVSAQTQPTYPPVTNYQTSNTGNNPQPPNYNAPPQYHGKRTSYIDSGDNDAVYNGRKDVNHYYK